MILKVPSFKYVYKWRVLQEKLLKSKEKYYDKQTNKKIYNVLWENY